MNAPEQKARGTCAHAPDLDWSQVRETVLMLALAAGQIEAALKDGNSSVEVLTDSFTSMAGTMRMMADVLAKADSGGIDPHLAAGLRGNAEQVADSVQRSIVAFQFYDKLTQRLAHVCHSLDALSDLVSDQNRLYTPNEWVALQQKIKARYTTADECKMFDAVMQGMTVQQAIEQYVSTMNSKGDDIELF
ncbi:MAG: hypothetical protein KF778_14010 [Rhodocyclaceae bacterium]|nr:hypothetical protein [Rhodocyclaceae bacterium]MBX3669509.1 hypothetical protein [Rhodocyclaceae bacterium]